MTKKEYGGGKTFVVVGVLCWKEFKYVFALEKSLRIEAWCQLGQRKDPVVLALGIQA